MYLALAFIKPRRWKKNILDWKNNNELIKNWVTTLRITFLTATN